MHVQDPQAVVALRNRNSESWWSCLIHSSRLEDFNTSTIRRVYFLGRLLETVGAEIRRTELNEPWDHAVEDVLPSEIRGHCGNIFASEFGETRSLEELRAHNITAILQRSEVFRDKPLPNILDLYDQITFNFPTSLPDWSRVRPSSTFGCKTLTAVSASLPTSFKIWACIPWKR